MGSLSRDLAGLRTFSALVAYEPGRPFAGQPKGRIGSEYGRLSSACQSLRSKRSHRSPGPSSGSSILVATAGLASLGTLLTTRRAKGPGGGQRLEDVDVYGRPLDYDLEGDESGLTGETGVVKVYCVHSSQDPLAPWANKTQEETTGSGCAIEWDGHLCLLTNAHVVQDATYVEVRKAGDARKFVATRQKVSHECDLATLSVEDPIFWEGVRPLGFGNMPSLQDEVSVVGFPEGGEGISITQGVVSRIEIQTYAHSGATLLAIQIDAAINPGNSGGPAIDDDGLVIGVAFQNQQQSQNIGYVIPVPIIKHFLADTSPEDPTRCSGFCSLGIFWQELENKQLRSFISIPNDRTGVLVRGLLPLAQGGDLLRKGDVILKVDGREIANDGSFAVGQQERLSFQHLVHLKFPGEKVNLLLLRDGQEVRVDVPVTPLRRLVPATVYDTPQPYFIYGGLSFVPLTSPYLQEWGEDWRGDAPHQLVALALAGTPNYEEEHPVILSRCFPSERTAGYQMLMDRRVISVSGHPVQNIKQMYTLVWKLHKELPFLEFELECIGCNAIAAVDTAIAEKASEEIMRTYRIPRAASPDLLESRHTVH